MLKYKYMYCIQPSAVSVFALRIKLKDRTLKFEYFCLTCCLYLMTELAREMNFTVDEINHVRLENPNSLTAQSFMLLKKWVSREGKNATSKTIFISENLLFGLHFFSPCVSFVPILTLFSLSALVVRLKSSSPRKDELLTLAY